MFEISRLTVEHLRSGCVTDKALPRFGFAVRSDRAEAKLVAAQLKVGDWETALGDEAQKGTVYAGAALKPFTTYSVKLTATDDAGETAYAETTFETGRMGTAWKAQWITDGSYKFTEKKVSPVPMVFRKSIQTKKPVAWARLYATAMAISYQL